MPFCEAFRGVPGHIITSSGLSPNPKQVAAVQDFPVPQSIHQLRQYLELTSYYVTADLLQDLLR